MKYEPTTPVLLRLLLLGTTPLGSLTSPARGAPQVLPGIPGLQGPILPGWYDLRDLFYRL